MGYGIKRIRFDLVEPAWLCFFCAVGGFAFGYTARSVTDPEVAPLEAVYGPHRYSQFFEQWIIRDFFEDKKNGFFVDVVASDYQRFSNTCFLEKELDWSGIAVDALAEFTDGYRRHRPRTRFFAFFVSNRSDRLAILNVLPSATEVASESQSFTERWDSVCRRYRCRP